MTKPAKPTKALERCAREIFDSDEFVQHIANIAQRYRREYAQERASTPGEQRQTLRAFIKHASALTDWLRASASKGTLENLALTRMGNTSDGMVSLFRDQSTEATAWLLKALSAAQHVLNEKTDPDSSLARRAAVAGVAATFEYHKLKWSTALTKQRQSDAIRLLVCLAKHAGDETATAEVLRETMRAIAI